MTPDYGQRKLLNEKKGMPTKRKIGLQKIAQRKERYANENANEKKDRTTKDAKNMLKYTIVSSFYNIMQ